MELLALGVVRPYKVNYMFLLIFHMHWIGPSKEIKTAAEEGMQTWSCTGHRGGTEDDNDRRQVQK
jgi:hypothetical protein